MTKLSSRSTSSANVLGDLLKLRPARDRGEAGEIAAWRWIAAIIAYALFLGGHSHIFSVSPFPA